MNFYGGKEMAASFRTVRKNTLVIANEIGEEHYGFQATPDTRTIAQTLVHIALASKPAEEIHRVQRLTSLENFNYMAFLGPLIADEQTPRTKAQIIDLLREGGDRFSSWLEGLSDEFLGERVTYPAGMTPPVKSRFEM